MKDSSSLGQLLVRVNLINEDQLRYAEEEVKYQAQLGKRVTLAQILVRAGMVKQEALTDILGVQMQSVTKKRIGEMLLDQGFITPDQLNEALEKQKTSGGKRLGRLLVEMGFIDEKKLTDILCCQFEVPFIKLDSIKLDEKVYEFLSEEQCKAYKVVPLYVSRDVRQALVVAMADPTNVRLRDSIKFKVKRNVDVVMASEQDIKKTIDILYAGHGPAEESLAELIGESKDEELETVERGQGNSDEPELTDEEGRAVVKIVTTLIHEAIARHASDIHLEPQETFLKLRYRIDGDLQVMSPIPARLMPQILSRIKLLSKMDIAEKRKPLDGRFTVRYKGSEVDLRVSSFPISLRKRGVCEKIVMRILDPNSGQFPLREMGFDARVLKQFIDAINAPNGIVLVTGPTGSGKSTTLYASIREILDSTINISTMEDPVELNIDGVNQGQINNAAGFTFAAGIRALLRQDPDVLLVGEIRDLETMQIALTAADTGHMVFATIHTTNAVETIHRILSMYPPHQHDEIRLLLAEVLVGIISLRLLPTKDGKGRVPAAEILVNTGAIKEYIQDKNKIDMVEQAVAEGHIQYHSQTFDQALLELYQNDQISLETAMNAATNRDDFDLKVRGITGTSDRGWM